MTNTSNTIDLAVLVEEIETVMATARARILELRDFFVTNEALLATHEAGITALQQENNASKKEIYNNAPSVEFIAMLDEEAKKVKQEIGALRQTVAALGEFSKKYEDQVLAFVELDTKITETLLMYKTLRK